MVHMGQSGKRAVPAKPKDQAKVIITCAVTGSIHTPTMSDHLPVTPDEIAQQAWRPRGRSRDTAFARAQSENRAADAGSGRLMQFLPRIKQRATPW